MTDLRGARVAVVGAGALGSAVALQVARYGADVTLYDAERLGENASGVAAGMLSPAFEAVLDSRHDHFPLLRAARDLWPDFIEKLGSLGAGLDRSGTIWAVQDDDTGALDLTRSALLRLGVKADVIGAAEIVTLQPSAASGLAGGVYTGEDWTLDPRIVLDAMRDAYRRAGGKVSAARVEPAQPIGVDGAALRADAVVLAVGAGVQDWVRLAAELAVIEPIKGQILHFAAPPFSGPVIRDRFGYAAPQARGCIVGATMQPGVNDCTVDAMALAGLRAGAARALPVLASAPAQGLAGVRAATPDGLPLVGQSSRPGLLLALGARRNGWLLAPLVADVITARLLGRDLHPFSAALDPLRPFVGRQHAQAV